MFSISTGLGTYDSDQGPKGDIPLTPEHGGPILCMDNTKDIVVTGSTDHGLRVYNLSDGKQTKQLYTKKYGHSEWVTTVQILPNRKIVSGGMDSNICLWDASGVRCQTFTEHTGSISKIVADKKVEFTYLVLMIHQLEYGMKVLHLLLLVYLEFIKDQLLI